MSLFKLSFSNFKRSVRNYGMLIVSLAFSVFIFFNFQNVLYSDSMDVLMDYKKDYIDMIVKAASVVFAVFLFFFIWYASNVFLNQRKKEIGIYIFMGLDNQRIGKMYVLEAVFIGLVSLVSGIVTGVLFSKLFQMLLLKLSDISVDVKFSFSLSPVLVTAAMFGGVYGLMTLKSYHTLATSSVLNLLSGAKQKEIRPEKGILTFLRILAGLGILGAGYYLAWDTNGMQALNNALAAVILVIAGVYLLFSGLIPALLRKLTGNKKYLYKKERNLWVNSLAFRMKKNYRTYAMVTVLMICSVTVLAFSIAMKQRYEKIHAFDRVYTCQVVSTQPKDGKEIARGIQQENELECWNTYELVILDSKTMHSKYNQTMYGVVSYSQVKSAAKAAGLSFPYKELKDTQVINLDHEILMSLAGSSVGDEKQQIGEKMYEVLAVDKTPYLGALQSSADIYVVSDKTFEELEGLGVKSYLYNYRLKKPENIEASKAYLQSLVTQDENGQYTTGVNYSQAQSKQDGWIRIMYSLCQFMFVTLVLAAGSIIFLKTGNEVYEDKERYRVLEKMGIQTKVLKKSVRNEICFTYYCPFVLMVVTSWFSIHALGNVMKEELLLVNLWSAGIVLVLFSGICLLSVRTARKRLFL